MTAVLEQVKPGDQQKKPTLVEIYRAILGNQVRATVGGSDDKAGAYVDLLEAFAPHPLLLAAIGGSDQAQACEAFTERIVSVARMRGDSFSEERLGELAMVVAAVSTSLTVNKVHIFGQNAVVSQDGQVTEIFDKPGTFPTLFSLEELEQLEAALREGGRRASRAEQALGLDATLCDLFQHGAYTEGSGLRPESLDTLTLMRQFAGEAIG